MKKAFSLVEILIVIGIIGIVSVAMITTLKPRELEVRYLYLSSYKFLKDACDNILMDAEHAEPAQEFPMNPNAFCNALIGYINIVPGTNKCSAAKPAYSATTFSEAWTPSFIASNHMRLYVSNATTINGKAHIIVWVDLNGDRKPNTSKWKQNKVADVVGFDVDADGDITILGYPRIDTRYLVAKIYYSSGEIGDEFSKKMTFYEAQKRAFNGKQLPDDPLSLDINSSLPSSSDLRVPANLIPTATPTEYDRKKCTLDDDIEYSSCSIKLEA